MVRRGLLPGSVILLGAAAALVAAGESTVPGPSCPHIEQRRAELAADANLVRRARTWLPPGTIDGAEHPDLVPQHIAFRLLMRALSAGKQAPPSDVKIIPAAARRASPGAAPDGRPWEAGRTPLQAGSAADDPWCGDGSCQSSAGEDCSSCPEDCGACPPPGPSCGEIGGSYCSQSGACPDDFDSLGATYDCNPCCKSQPPPAENLYIYEEYALDASTFSATGVAETDGGRQVRVVVTLVAPDESVMLSCSRCDSPWAKSTAR